MEDASDVVRRMNDGYKAWSVLKSVLRLGITLLMQKQCIRGSNCTNHATLLYGAETWGMRSAERRVNVLEMKCLISMVGMRNDANG